MTPSVALRLPRWFRSRAAVLVAAPFLACTPPTPSAPPEPIPDSSHDAATELAALIVRSGIRTSMLAGDALTVRDFVGHVRANHGGLSLQIYAATGARVYDEPGPAPDPSTLDPELAATLQGAGTRISADGRYIEQLKNDASCRKCHAEHESRGVLFVRPNADHPITSDDASLMGLHEVIEGAFSHMMSVGAADELGSYFESLSEHVPGVKNSAVFSRDGEPTLGDAFMDVPEDIRKRALSNREVFIHRADDDVYVVKPLLAAPGCLNCHEDSGPVRGALVTHFQAGQIAPEETLPHLITHSLRHVMLNGLGRILYRYLDDISNINPVQELQLYDREGRTFFDSEHVPVAPPEITAMLQSTDPQPQILHDTSLTRFLLPLHSEPKCQQCHSDGQRLRGIIEVSFPTTAL